MATHHELAGARRRDYHRAPEEAPMRLMAMICALAIAACGGGGGGGDDVDANLRPDGVPQGTPDGPGPLNCAAYCARMASVCVGANLQYASEANCMDSCATWDIGSQGEMSNNTLGCRTYHAGAAIADADLHCRHAGPGGDGACGTNCVGFCNIVTEVCTGADQVYDNLTECTSMCSGFPTLPPYNASIQSGDTLACRLYHATAASSDPGTHCPHTAVVSSTCQ
jgi:hypothetical protein